jgi:hypothetical protein
MLVSNVGSSNLGLFLKKLETSNAENKTSSALNAHKMASMNG